MGSVISEISHAQFTAVSVLEMSPSVAKLLLRNDAYAHIQASTA